MDSDDVVDTSTGVIELGDVLTLALREGNAEAVLKVLEGASRRFEAAAVPRYVGATRETELIDRQQIVCLEATLDNHPFMEYARRVAGEYIAEKGYISVTFLGMGSGREAEVIASIAKLREIIGVEHSFKRHPLDSEEKKQEREDKRKKATTKIFQARPEGLDVKIYAESFSDRNYTVPKADVLYMSAVLHDQPQEDQIKLLENAYAAGVKSVIIVDAFLPMIPNYGYEGRCPEEIERELSQFYIEWLRATAAIGLPQEQFKKYVGTIVNDAFPRAVRADNHDEQFETIVTITRKLSDAGFGVVNVVDVPGSKYLKTVIAERK